MSNRMLGTHRNESNRDLVKGKRYGSRFSSSRSPSVFLQLVDPYRFTLLIERGTMNVNAIDRTSDQFNAGRYSCAYDSFANRTGSPLAHQPRETPALHISGKS